MTGPAALELTEITRRFGDRTAVDRLSFRVEAGSVFGFLGPNGAGKTTTLRMVLGLVAPTSGRLEVLGAPDGRSVRDRIGFLPEERGLHPRMTPLQAAGFLGGLKGVPAASARRKARDLLEGLGLGASLNTQIRRLSKGMAQQVALVCTLLHDPALIILDEPFSGLDPLHQQGLERLIAERSRAGATILFSTHVMAHAERLCDKVVLLAQGRKVGGVKLRLQAVEQHATVGLREHLALGFGVGIAETDAQQETVELRVGQGEGPGKVDRILGRDHQERLRQPMRASVDRDLAFGHRLQQRALRLRCGAIDFVGHHDLGEHRSRMERELCAVALVDRYAEDVGWQQVAGELDALEGQAERAGEGMRQRRFAHPRQVLHQKVAVGHHAGEGEANAVGLAQQHAVDLRNRGSESIERVADAWGSRGGSGLGHDVDGSGQA